MAVFSAYKLLFMQSLLYLIKNSDYVFCIDQKLCLSDETLFIHNISLYYIKICNLRQMQISTSSVLKNLFLPKSQDM
jgi:hypothetical protein